MGYSNEERKRPFKDKNRTMFWIGIILLILYVLATSGCADVSHAQVTYPQGEHTYGFWGGLWHGMIAPIAFIGYLFSDDIAVYALNNNGGWYLFGFLLGVGAFTGGASKASKSK